MPSVLPQTPRVVQLAEMLHDDLLKRDLKPGDPFYSTMEAARAFRVSGTIANKALQLLAQRGIISRKQRKGTFVIDPSPAIDDCDLRRIHLLVHQSYMRTEGMYTDGVVIGMQTILPGVNVLFNFMPPLEEEPFVTNLIDEARAAPHPEGFVLVRSSLVVQRLLENSGMPCVVHGSVYPSVNHLPWLNRDNRRIGSMLAHHLLKRGHRSLLVLRRERLLPGDWELLDGVRDAVIDAGLPSTIIICRELPPEDQVIRLEVGSVLRQLGSKRPGIIAVTERHANGAEAAITDLDLIPGKDIAIGITDVYRRGNERRPRHPFIRLTDTPEEQGRQIGRMLKEMWAKGRSDEHYNMPVELVIPETE